MSEIKTITSIDVSTIRPFKKFIMTIGELPTSYLESMTYAELVMWFCNFLETKVIPALNNNAEAVKEIQDFINTLDIQDEVNKKLDEMAEDGTLQEIMAEYLNTKAVFGFSDIESLKSATNLINGSLVKTYGFYNINDGGGASYRIRNVTNIDIIDEITLFALSDTGLVAELIHNDVLNIDCLGAKKDGIFDNKNIIDKAINLLNNGGKIIFGAGNYLTSGNHIIDTIGELTITGNGINTTNITFNGNNFLFWCQNQKNSLLVPINIENMKITNTSTENCDCIIISDRYGYCIKNILCYSFDKGSFIKIYNYNGWTEGTKIINCASRGCAKCISTERNNESNSATESFFNTIIDNVSASLSIPYAKLLDIGVNANTNNICNCYSWNIKCTAWFEGTGGGKQIINVNPYSILTGICDITQDGTSGKYDGSDLNTLLVRDNGQADLIGNILYKQNMNQTSLIKFSQLVKQATNWRYDTYLRPLAKFTGAKINFNGIIESGTLSSVIYESGFLLPYSLYKITIAMNGNNGSSKYCYLINTINLNINPVINNIIGNPRLFIVRPKGNGTPGGYQANNGLQFEIFMDSNAGTAVTYDIEIEML